MTRVEVTVYKDEFNRTVEEHVTKCSKCREVIGVMRYGGSFASSGWGGMRCKCVSADK